MELQQSAKSGDAPAPVNLTPEELTELLLASAKQAIAGLNMEAADLVDEQLKMATAHGSCFVAALLEALQRVWPVIADAVAASQSAKAETVAQMMARVNGVMWAILAKQMEPVAAEIAAMGMMASSRGGHHA